MSRRSACSAAWVTEENEKTGTFWISCCRRRGMVGAARGVRRRGRGDQPRLCQGGKRKLTESAREFPKAFRLAEPVSVAPGGAGATARTHHYTKSESKDTR